MGCFEIVQCTCNHQENPLGLDLSLIHILYSMILRDFELEQNKNFYIVDKEGYVVFHRD